MSDASGTRFGGARGRMVLMAGGLALCVLAIIGASLEWGRLIVNGRLVVVEGGLSLWQGVTVLVAAVVGALLMAFAVASGRGRAAGLVALVAGAVITIVSINALSWLVTRPDELADQVSEAAADIPLEGYVVPRIESVVGPGGWMALAGGVLLAIAGLVAVVTWAWSGRGRAGVA